MKKLLLTLTLSIVPLISHSHGVEYDSNVDSNYITSCDPDHVIVGFTGGYGHSSNHNSPHKIICIDISNINPKNSLGGHVSTFLTGTDSDFWTSCPGGYVMTGISGGYGHSSNHNKPHAIQCTNVNNMTGGNSYSTYTGVDSNSPTYCPNGYAMNGLLGGYGHSSKYNQSHKINCVELK